MTQSTNSLGHKTWILTKGNDRVLFTDRHEGRIECIRETWDARFRRHAVHVHPAMTTEESRELWKSYKKLGYC